MPPYYKLRGYIDDLRLVDLFLDGVHVDVSIVDVHAKAVMSQRFTNTYNNPVEATYTFSMLANSAVCGFRMIRGDGTIVEGHVMEKKAAKKAYETAKKSGKTAGLGEEQTNDLFTIKVGNIQSSETITIKLTFLIPLIDDEKRDQIRFTFPRAYGERYGTPPTEEAANISATTGASQKFSINVLVQQAGAIKSISCPSSHPIELTLGQPDGISIDSSVADSNVASVKMVSAREFLTQNFILVITSAGLDSPRCFVEPSIDGKTTAIGMTFVPRFKVADVKGGMEYIFVVDRSGSMEETPIKLVRQALVVLLRGLPTKDTLFNIVSFGTHADSLWPSSKPYSQSSLEEATAHVDTMDANYGGTEIAAALNLVYKSLPEERQKPVSIFVLTDGGSWDIDTCKDLTSAAIDSPGPFIRVFTVGIGSGVSTDTTESIARAGGGMAIYVQDGEPMTGKLGRLVRAARTPPIKDLEVLWPASKEADEDFEMVEAGKEEVALQEPQKVNLYNENDNEVDIDVGPPPKPEVKPTDVPVAGVQQAPLNIAGLFPGTRTEIYAIVSAAVLERDRLQQGIRVRGKVGGTNDIVELDVDVTKSLSSDTSGAQLIHTFAARALLTDRQDGKHTFTSSISSNPSLLEAYLEAEIIRLGTTYGLTSRYTSYVAIDEEHAQQPLGSGTTDYQGIDAFSYDMSEPMSVPVTVPTTCFSMPLVAPVARGYMAYSPSSLYRSFAHEDAVRLSDHHEGMDLSNYDPSLAGMTVGIPMSGPVPAPVTAVPTEVLPWTSYTASASPGYSPDSPRYSPISPHYSPASPSYSLASGDCEDDMYLPNEVYTAGLVGVTPQTEDTGLTGLARLQRFDGSFTLCDRLFQLLDISSKPSGAPAQANEDAIATSLALVWMQREAAEDGEDMIEKADEWLKDQVEEGVYKELLEWARKAFVLKLLL